MRVERLKDDTTFRANGWQMVVSIQWAEHLGPGFDLAARVSIALD